jgi:hypothetical protein
VLKCRNDFIAQKLIAALDLDIGRLKRQLIGSLITSSDPTADEAALKVSHKIVLVSPLFLLSGVQI